MFTSKFKNNISNDNQDNSRRVSFLSNIDQNNQNIDMILPDERRRNSAFPISCLPEIESLKGMIKSMVTKSTMSDKIEEISSGWEVSSSDRESDYYSDDLGWDILNIFEIFIQKISKFY